MLYKSIAKRGPNMMHKRARTEHCRRLTWVACSSWRPHGFLLTACCFHLHVSQHLFLKSGPGFEKQVLGDMQIKQQAISRYHQLKRKGPTGWLERCKILVTRKTICDFDLAEMHEAEPPPSSHCDEGVLSATSLSKDWNLAGVNEEVFKILGEQNHLRFWLGWADCAPFS